MTGVEVKLYKAKLRNLLTDVMMAGARQEPILKTVEKFAEQIEKLKNCDCDEFCNTNSDFLSCKCSCHYGEGEI